MEASSTPTPDGFPISRPSSYSPDTPTSEDRATFLHGRKPKSNIVGQLLVRCSQLLSPH